MSINNISLYIKRANLCCTKDYINNIFMNNKIGIVKDVKFVKKNDNSGKEYNGIIVIFERWFMNANVTKLLNDIDTSSDGTAKFIYDHNGRYWYINIYKPVIPESVIINVVDPSLPDNKRIEELEKLVQSMSAQLQHFQYQQEITERKLMEIEEKHSYYFLCNMDLRFQLEDKEMQLKDANDEIIILKCRIGCMSIDLARKDEELSMTL